MRVCILNDNFYRGSGITVALRRIVESPPFQGVEVYLVGCETIGGKKSLQEDVSFLPEGRYRYFPMMQAGPALIPALFRFAAWLRKMHIDVLHVHHRRLAVLANLLTPFTKVPVVFTGHLTFPGAAWFREFAPRTLTGVSPSVVEYLRLNTKAEDIRLIYNPVEFPKTRGGPSSPRPYRAMSVGRLDPIKGYSVLIEAWPLLRAKGIEAKLDIYGEGSLRPALESQIADLKLEQHISLCGFTSNIADSMPNYSFNILVSQKEGFPNAVVEAAAYGLPTLLTDVDGSRDALPPHLCLTNGLPYGDANALCIALFEWFKAPELLLEDGRCFHDYLEPLCSPEIVGSQYLALYTSLSRKNGSSDAVLRH